MAAVFLCESFVSHNYKLLKMLITDICGFYSWLLQLRISNWFLYNCVQNLKVWFTKGLVPSQDSGVSLPSNWLRARILRKSDAWENRSIAIQTMVDSNECIFKSTRWLISRFSGCRCWRWLPFRQGDCCASLERTTATQAHLHTQWGRIISTVWH